MDDTSTFHATAKRTEYQSSPTRTTSPAHAALLAAPIGLLTCPNPSLHWLLLLLLPCSLPWLSLIAGGASTLRASLRKRVQPLTFGLSSGNYEQQHAAALRARP